MSSTARAMEFEEMPFKKPTAKATKHVGTKLTKKMALDAVEPLSTSTLLWYIAKRHKVGLLWLALLGENTYLVAHFFNVI